MRMQKEQAKGQPMQVIGKRRRSNQESIIKMEGRIEEQKRLKMEDLVKLEDKEVYYQAEEIQL